MSRQSILAHTLNRVCEVLKTRAEEATVQMPVSTGRATQCQIQPVDTSAAAVKKNKGLFYKVGWPHRHGEEKPGTRETREAMHQMLKPDRTNPRC